MTRQTVNTQTIYGSLRTMSASTPIFGPWRLDIVNGVGVMGQLCAIHQTAGIVVPWHNIALLTPETNK